MEAEGSKRRGSRRALGESSNRRLRGALTGNQAKRQRPFASRKGEDPMEDINNKEFEAFRRLLILHLEEVEDIDDEKAKAKKIEKVIKALKGEKN
ncbi:MAG TPA: hypothetical protein IAC12_07105 [Candidatus Aphodovivens avistercoris]|nr:hypothetical protein [Candidatus Aphodovivens avistercoris]